MSIDYKIESSFVNIIPKGIWDKPKILKAQDESSAIVKKNSLNGLLLDLRTVEMKVSTVDIFEVNRRLSKVFPLNVKHAVVYNEESFSISDATFNENVATNYGTLIKMFKNIDEAKSWLEKA